MILNGKSAQFAAQVPQFARSDAEVPQEDVSALLRQIGSPDYFDFSDVSGNGSPAARFLESFGLRVETQEDLFVRNDPLFQLIAVSHGLFPSLG